MTSSLVNRLQAATRKRYELVGKYRDLYRNRRRFDKILFDQKLTNLRNEWRDLLPSEKPLTEEHSRNLNPTPSTQKAMKNFIAAAGESMRWDSKCSKHLNRLVMQDGPDHSGWFWLIPAIFMLLVLAMYLMR